MILSGLVSRIGNVSVQTKVAPIDETTISNEWFIGCDEAGVGETFGSMFLGCVLISKDKLSNVQAILGRKNIRELSHSDIVNTFNAIKNNFSYKLHKYSATEIDEMSKNVLLDRGYIQLIKNYSNTPKACIIVDDYQVKSELRIFQKYLESQGHTVIIKTKADENYTACKLASLVARKARSEELEHISKTEFLIDPITGERILPATGAAANPLTEKYLVAYRKQYPHSEFPSFVRKKWQNVAQIEEKYPKKQSTLLLSCELCNNIINRIEILYSKESGTRFYCTRCFGLISVSHFRSKMQKISIVLDTSSLISRIVTKDLDSNQYFRNNIFLLPSFVYEELDTKQPDTKRGGHKEIAELNDKRDNGIIGFEEIKTDYMSPQLITDKKIISLLADKNAAILTKDANMASFASIDHFSFMVKGM